MNASPSASGAPPKPPRSPKLSVSFRRQMSPETASAGAGFSDAVIRGVETRLLKAFDTFRVQDWLSDKLEITLIEEMHKGQNGRVYKGSYSGSSSEVAIKVLDVVDDEQEQINMLCELSLLRALPSDRFVNFLGARAVPGGTKILIVTETCKYGALRELILHKELPWNLRVRLIFDTAQALVFLHERRVVHRDVKPTNILVDERARAKLCDFGFVVHARSSSKNSCGVFGTTEFMAPEVAQGSDFGTAADVFSLGVCMIEVITGLQPSSLFLRRGPRDGFAIDELEASREVMAGCPPALEALAYLCCSTNPVPRPSAEQVAMELSVLLRELGGTFEVGDILDDVALGVGGLALRLSGGDEREGTVVFAGPGMGIASGRRRSGSGSLSAAASTAASPMSPRLDLVDVQLQELRAENARLSRDLQALALAGALGVTATAASPSRILENSTMASPPSTPPPLPPQPQPQPQPQPAATDERVLALVLDAMGTLTQQLATLVPAVAGVQARLGGLENKVEQQATVAAEAVTAAAEAATAASEAVAQARASAVADAAQAERERADAIAATREEFERLVAQAAASAERERIEAVAAAKTELELLAAHAVDRAREEQERLAAAVAAAVAATAATAAAAAAEVQANALAETRAAVQQDNSPPSKQSPDPTTLNSRRHTPSHLSFGEDDLDPSVRARGTRPTEIGAEGSAEDDVLSVIVDLTGAGPAAGAGAGAGYHSATRRRLSTFTQPIGFATSEEAQRRGQKESQSALPLWPPHTHWLSPSPAPAPVHAPAPALVSAPATPQAKSEASSQLNRALSGFLEVIDKCAAASERSKIGKGLSRLSDTSYAERSGGSTVSSNGRSRDGFSSPTRSSRSPDLWSKPSPMKLTVARGSPLSRSLETRSPKSPQTRPLASYPNQRHDPSKVYRVGFDDFRDQTSSPRRPMLARFNRSSEEFLRHGNSSNNEP